MNHIEFQALRRLLFFSIPEAAQLVGKVSERGWRLWESGERPVPDDVAGQLRIILQWRQDALAAARSQIARAHAAAGEPAAIALVWYASQEDWEQAVGPAWHWRPHCSVQATIKAEYDNVVLVGFDPDAYGEWLGQRKDNEAMRAAWAASVG